MAIHGGKDQEDRMSACRAFRGGEKDVLVATDIASKGLDFPDIMHVINYDMPEDIENYIHRIGRTGRGNNTGVATTFVNSKSCDKSILLDLKGTLIPQKSTNNQVREPIGPRFLEFRGSNSNLTMKFSITDRSRTNCP